MRVVLAGQEICDSVDEFSIDISETLGQGPGVWGGSVGRAATCHFRTTLGPVAAAVGAGQKDKIALAIADKRPVLVRMGEVSIYDKDGHQVYGGYVGQLSDVTERTRIYTDVSCYDYWQHLDRINVTEVFDGQDDIQIITFLLRKYAPDINRSLLPQTGKIRFGPRIFRNISLQKAIQKIVDAVGWSIWIDYDKTVHYYDPAHAPLAPFSVSTSPDGKNSFDLEVAEYTVDDTSAINNVTCYGGRQLSDDITQDLSTQANGRNTIFQFPFYPHKASDGKYHVRINNGRDLSIGFAGGDTKRGMNTLKPKGRCDVLLNAAAKALTFAVSPKAGSLVTFTYRYEKTMVRSFPDEDSRAFYGMRLDGTISDETIIEPEVAAQRSKTLLYEQSQGLTTIKFTTHRNGLRAGMMVQVLHPLRGINNRFLIQEVHPVPLGAGQFKYEISAGAWSWKLVDLFIHTAHKTTLRDNTEFETNESAVPVTVQVVETLDVTDVWTVPKTGHLTHYYYARSAPKQDEHDAYPGKAWI